METQRFDLEDRLITFACKCLEVCESLPAGRAGKNLEYQLAKSGTAAALIYGEALAAESRTDFIHKMKMALKELRETRINLRIIIQKPLLNDNFVIDTLKEANQLIAIFTTSIQTAKKNLNK